MKHESEKARTLFHWTAVLAAGAVLFIGISPAPAAMVQKPRPLNLLVLLGEWFGDAYFPLKEEIEARGWTMKRVGLDGEYRGCYNKKRDVVLTSDVVIRDGLDLSGYDALIIPSGPQFRKFRENPAVLKFVKDAHAAGLLIASFCVGNNTVRDAGLIDIPYGPGLFPEKVTLIKERILIGPRGGGPPPGDGFESAPIKEVCDAVARELTGKTAEAKAGKSPLSLDYLGNMSKHLQEVFRPDHIALGHLPIKLESDAPGKIDMVRGHYKDIFLLLPGMPEKTF